jgi:hypothetical protein
MASSHCVFAIGQHEHKLGTPNCRHATQVIQEASYQVENIFSNVLLEHWDGDQVQNGQDTIDINTDVHVAEQTATMCAAIPNDRKHPDQWVQQQIRDLV